MKSYGIVAYIYDNRLDVFVPYNSDGFYRYEERQPAQDRADYLNRHHGSTDIAFTVGEIK